MMDDSTDEDPPDYTNDPYAIEALRIARGVLDGSITLFDGCSQLSRPLWKLYLYEEEPFVTVMQIAGKLKEHPSVTDRPFWNPEAAARKDKELAAWLPVIKDQVHAACREIIRRFGSDG